MAVKAYNKICPTCRLNAGMNCQLSESNGVFVCSNNPQHKFEIGKDGFLKSVK